MYNLYVTVMAFLMKISIYADSWKSSLPVVLFGMLGIFIVIGVVVLLTYLLNKLTSGKKKNDKDEK
ncbi:MAG: hypothetical protein SOY48_06530 [Eubacterium sp.]|nr:hypothetical protein [Eubacterium sp.]MDD6568110.1 hypothetical protein [Eubacteriales bacterium]MDY4110522.1 hypothetical protein [Eubacterium sp.]